MAHGIKTGQHRGSRDCDCHSQRGGTRGRPVFRLVNAARQDEQTTGMKAGGATPHRAPGAPPRPTEVAVVSFGAHLLVITVLQRKTGRPRSPNKVRGTLMLNLPETAISGRDPTYYLQFPFATRRICKTWAGLSIKAQIKSSDQSERPADAPGRVLHLT
jgi:hypothetical protein